MVVSVRKSPKPPVLTGTEERVLLALTAGKSKREAAEFAKVHPQAVSQMFRREQFVDALRRVQVTLLDEATSALSNLVRNAVEVIKQTLRSDEPALRYKAATFVVERMLLPALATRDTASAPNILEMRGSVGGAEQLPATMTSAMEALQHLEENPNECDADDGT